MLSKEELKYFMTKCKFCESKIKPEVTSKLENWGTIKIYQCPKCNMTLNIESVGSNKWGRKFEHIKDILKRIVIN